MSSKLSGVLPAILWLQEKGWERVDERMQPVSEHLHQIDLILLQLQRFLFKRGLQNIKEWRAAQLIVGADPRKSPRRVAFCTALENLSPITHAKKRDNDEDWIKL